jgi:hypothetical protein
MNGKKAITTFEMLMWVPRIVFLVAVMFAVAFLVKSHITTTIDISEARANIFVNRAIYSQSDISYFDSSTGRAYPGIIEMQKFKEHAGELLEKSIYYSEKNREVGARFLLKNLESSEEAEAFYNEEFFREQKKIAASGFTEGPGGARLYVKNYNVLILIDGSLYKGLLTIEVAIPNS